MNLLTLNEVREILETGKPFSIEFCSYDEKRNTGGDRKIYSSCTLVQAVKMKGKSGGKKRGVKKNGRNPSHFENNTFNIKLESGEIRKVHWLLVERLNNIKVVL